MEIDKILYNITLSDKKEESQCFIAKLSKEQLHAVKTEIIERVINCNPDDQNAIQEVRTAFILYDKLQINKEFRQVDISDESFVCSLAFYIESQTQSQKLELCIKFIEHQFIELNQKGFSKSINLFKALFYVYEHIHQSYYEQIVNIMMKMILQNHELMEDIHHSYCFLECMIQLLNQQSNEQKLLAHLAQITKMYDLKKKGSHLFHQKDLKILMEILIRILKNQQLCKFRQTIESLIEQSLKLYLFLSEDSHDLLESSKLQELKESILDNVNKTNNEQIKKLADLILSKKG